MLNTARNSNEQELLSLIREADDPAEAIITAIQIFTSFLAQCEADQSPMVVCPPVSA
jgi:hypothetical protein